MDREQDFLGGPICMVQHERPTQLPRSLLKIEAMAFNTPLVLLPKILCTTHDHRRAAFGCLELGTPLVWQRLLSRIENLNQVTANALTCDLVEALDEFVDGLKEIREEDALRKPVQACTGGKTIVRCLSEEDLSHLAARIAAR